MSGQATRQSEEKLVPFSVVLVTVGIILLLAAFAVWAVAPSTVPWALYNLATSILPDDMAQVLPTPATLARVPARATRLAAEENDRTIALLPETPLEADAPTRTVSLADEVERDPLAGQPMRIVIPKIYLDAPVMDIGLEPFESDGQTYYQWLVPNQFEAGWHDNSARLGQEGNTVLNGHHNVFGEVFGDLVDLNMGDRIVIYDAEEAYIYEVTKKEIFQERGQPISVRLENARWIEPTDDERVTLVTCWPDTDNSHRLIVVAEPVSDEESEFSLGTQ